MKFEAGFALIIAASLVVASVSGLARQKPQSRPQARPDRPMQQDRTYDRDRSQSRNNAGEKDRKQDQEQEKAKARDQAQQKERDIYGYQLMTEQERNEYRERIKMAETIQERNKVITEHREKMQVRAKEKSVDLEKNEESE